MEPLELARAVEAAYGEALPSLSLDQGPYRQRVIHSPFKASIDIRLGRDLAPEAAELTAIRSRLIGRAAVTWIESEAVRLRYKVLSAGEEDRDAVLLFARHVTEFLGEPPEHLLMARVAYLHVPIFDTPGPQDQN